MIERQHARDHVEYQSPLDPISNPKTLRRDTTRVRSDSLTHATYATTAIPWKERMKLPTLRFAALVALTPLLTLGCTDRSGTAYLEIVNDQSALGDKAEPVQVDPRVEVLVNEYQRSYLNQGSNIRQRIVIKGPVMIIPAPAIPSTQPAK